MSPIVMFCTGPLDWPSGSAICKTQPICFTHIRHKYFLQVTISQNTEIFYECWTPPFRLSPCFLANHLGSFFCFWNLTHVCYRSRMPDDGDLLVPCSTEHLNLLLLGKVRKARTFLPIGVPTCIRRNSMSRWRSFELGVEVNNVIPKTCEYGVRSWL